MVGAILQAVGYIGLGGAIVCAVVFMAGLLWITFGPKSRDHRMAKSLRRP